MEPVKHINFRFSLRRWNLGIGWERWREDTTIWVSVLCLCLEIHTNP